MSSHTKSALQWTCNKAFDSTQQTIILIHAAWMTSTMFDETVQHISPLLPNVNIIRVDLNGHGKTVSGRKTYTLWDQAEDVITLMDELQIEKAAVAGISMGACIALRIALSHNSRLTALILMASTASAATPEDNAGIAQMRDVWVATPSPSEEIMNAAISSWGGEPDVNGPRAQRIKRDWVERYSGADRVDATLRSIMQRDDVLGLLHKVTGPVLIVHGELDQTWPLEQAVSIQEGLVNASVDMRVVKGSGHLVVWMRDSEDVSQMIAGFVKDQMAEQH